VTGSSEPAGLYELLGVRPGAPAAEITRAYHRRARVLHPDAQPGRAGQAARFRELEAAYRVLSDPARRAAYDGGLRRAAARPAATPPRPPAGRPGPGWPAARPPGATVWAGPVHVIPPAASPRGPGPVPVGTWLAALAAEPGSALGWDWPW
jgi:curved DNA-binding protein CbpA